MYAKTTQGTIGHPVHQRNLDYCATSDKAQIFFAWLDPRLQFICFYIVDLIISDCQPPPKRDKFICTTHHEVESMRSAAKAHTSDTSIHSQKDAADQVLGYVPTKSNEDSFWSPGYLKPAHCPRDLE